MNDPDSHESVRWAPAVRDLLKYLLPANNWTWDWFGERVGQLPDSLEAEVETELHREWLVDQMTDLLYSCFYSTGGPVNPQTGIPPLSELPESDQVKLCKLDHGEVLLPVVKVGVATPSEVRVSLRNGLDLLLAKEEANQKIQVLNGGNYLRVPAASRWTQRGFIWFQAAGELDKGGSYTGRLYLNTSPSALTDVVKALLDIRSRSEYELAFKVLTTWERKRRCDSCVVYCSSVVADDLVRRIVEESPIPEGLQPTVPVFTKPCAPGIAYADEPGYGLSFGQLRSESLARAIVEVDRHGDEGAATVEQRLARLVAALGADDFHWEEPWRMLQR